MVRLNFSHGENGDKAASIAKIRAIGAEKGIRLPIIADLSGPKLRIGKFASGQAELRPGERFTLRAAFEPGDSTGVSVNCPEILKDLKKGDRVLLGDGEFELRVVSPGAAEAECEVLAGGILKSNKGLSAPGASISTVVPTDKDVEDAKFAIGNGVDWIALSFVRSPAEIRRMKSVIAGVGGSQSVIAKIEKREALEELDGILEESDAVMIARGDMGLEIPLEYVPLRAKEITAKANLRGVPVITATQMLESMIFNPRPTRAEVSDIANAILDGTDALMLSGETAVGKYPVEAVEVMDRVAAATEAKIDYRDLLERRSGQQEPNVSDAVAHAACHTALQTGAAVIICCTRSGQTARHVARYRPRAVIAVASPYENTLMKTAILWGAVPVKIPVARDTDSMVEQAKRSVLESRLARKGDRAVIIAGAPVNVPGATNMIRVDTL